MHTTNQTEYLRYKRVVPLNPADHVSGHLIHLLSSQVFGDGFRWYGYCLIEAVGRLMRMRPNRYNTNQSQSLLPPPSHSHQRNLKQRIRFEIWSKHGAHSIRKFRVRYRMEKKFSGIKFRNFGYTGSRGCPNVLGIRATDLVGEPGPFSSVICCWTWAMLSCGKNKRPGGPYWKKLGPLS